MVYPRRGTPALAEQAKLYITLSENEVVHLVANDDVLRLAVPTEARSYELHGLTAPSNAPFTFDELLAAADIADEIAFTDPPTGIGTEEKRLLARSRTRYLADDLSAPLAFTPVTRTVRATHHWIIRLINTSV